MTLDINKEVEVVDKAKKKNEKKNLEEKVEVPSTDQLVDWRLIETNRLIGSSDSSYPRPRFKN
jgi:hypothetical protein